MKTLTVKQPWASLIVEGIKDIENRTWKCPQKYIGKRVLIHAGASKELDHIPLDGIFSEQQLSYLLSRFTEYELCEREYPHGAIIGSVEIVDCVINHPSIWAEKSETNCSEKCRSKNCEHHIDWDCGECWCSSCKLIGQSYEVCEVPKGCPHSMKINTAYNWALANPIKFTEPIPCKGKLSFWDFPFNEEELSKLIR